MSLKTLGLILKIVAAVLAVAGIIFVIVAYGDKIVAWVKKTFGKFFGCCDCDCECECDCDCDCCCDEAIEEVNVDASDSDFAG